MLNSFFIFSSPVEGELRKSEYLGQKYFFLTIIATFFLHLSAMYVWHLVPQAQVVDIPVTALNIKLGDEEEMDKVAQPDADNKSDVESAISKMVISQEVDNQTPVKPDSAATASQATKVLDKAMADPSAKQFIRANAVQATGKGGSSAGNSSAREAEMMSRYEQLISLWIEKFKLYPEDARTQGIQGETIVRIRIDRQGNIRYYILEHSTGYQILDRAAIDMVKRANPVPAVPNDYPKGDLMEFLIPVNFQLQ